MVVRTRTKYLLFTVPALSAISIVLLIFFLGPDNNANLFTIEKDNVNSASDNQQETSNSQSNIQNENDDYNLRGAVSNNSGGKQVRRSIKPMSVVAHLKREQILFESIHYRFPVLNL